MLSSPLPALDAEPLLSIFIVDWIGEQLDE